MADPRGSVEEYYLTLAEICNRGSERLQHEIAKRYSIFALLGTLQASIPLTGIAVWLWLFRTGVPHHWLVLVISLVLTLAVVVAFTQQRQGYVRFRKAAAYEVSRRPINPSES